MTDAVHRTDASIRPVKCKSKVIGNLWAEELLDLTNLWANERPGKKLHGEGTDTQTDRQTDIATY